MVAATQSCLKINEEGGSMIGHIIFCILVTLDGSESTPVVKVSLLQSGEKCDLDKITLLLSNSMLLSNSTMCISCKPCTPGFGASIPCGSVVTVNNEKESPQIECIPCQEERTYSDSRSTMGCKPCRKCTSNDHVMRNCTPYSDTICYSCGEGFYFSSEKLSCLPCWRCCGDGKDILVDECMAQGSHYRCSFDNKRRCQYSTDRIPTSQPRSMSEFYRTKRITIPIDVKLIATLTTPGISDFQRTPNKNYKFETVSENKSEIIILINVLVIIVVILCLFVTFKIYFANRKGRNLGKCIHCFCTTPSKKPQVISENNQSDELDDWAKYYSLSAMYLFKCGASICHDKTSIQDGNRDLVVEILSKSLPPLLKTLDPSYMFISSVFKFYSQGTQFEKPVEISLPHNALIDPTNKNWEMKVLYVDEREGMKAKWKKIESEVNTEWDKVKFHTNTLLTYAVVGKPMASAKKRMQFVLFSMQKMTSDRLEMVLYLLDEGNTSLDRVIKENKSKGWEMIGSLYAVFVDCFSPVDIVIDVEELLEPWSLVHLKDKVISSQLLQDSYFNIPTVHAKFRRSERSAQKFYCNFRVDVGGKEINIPAVTFVPEEMLCVYVEVHNEDPSIFDNQILARDIPYDLNYLMCRKLDVPARGLGQWRDFGRYFKLTEEDLQECCRQYATLDGSPSKALVEMICNKNPKVTVGEFAKCLDKLGRDDVMSVLSKVK